MKKDTGLLIKYSHTQMLKSYNLIFMGQPAQLWNKEIFVRGYTDCGMEDEHYINNIKVLFHISVF